MLLLLGKGEEGLRGRRCLLLFGGLCFFRLRRGRGRGAPALLPDRGGSSGLERRRDLDLRRRWRSSRNSSSELERPRRRREEQRARPHSGRGSDLLVERGRSGARGEVERPRREGGVGGGRPLRRFRRRPFGPKRAVFGSFLLSLVPRVPCERGRRRRGGPGRRLRGPEGEDGRRRGRGDDSSSRLLLLRRRRRRGLFSLGCRRAPEREQRRRRLGSSGRRGS